MKDNFYYKINRKDLIDFLNTKSKEHEQIDVKDKFEIKLDSNDFTNKTITILVNYEN